jgi:hypothetical protein
LSDLIIACDLSGFSGHYDQLAAYLAKLGAELIQHGLWKLRRTTLTAARVHAEISRFMHPCDKLFVAALAVDC